MVKYTFFIVIILYSCVLDSKIPLIKSQIMNSTLMLNGFYYSLENNPKGKYLEIFFYVKMV